MRARDLPVRFDLDRWQEAQARKVRAQQRLGWTLFACAVVASIAAGLQLWLLAVRMGWL